MGSSYEGQVSCNPRHSNDFTVHLGIQERVPRNVDQDRVLSAIRGIPGVSEVHDLHIWGVKPGMAILTVHVHVEEGTAGIRVTRWARGSDQVGPGCW
jgi:hypothetical protein